MGNAWHCTDVSALLSVLGQKQPSASPFCSPLPLLSLLLCRNPPGPLPLLSLLLLSRSPPDTSPPSLFAAAAKASTLHLLSPVPLHRPPPEPSPPSFVAAAVEASALPLLSLLLLDRPPPEPSPLSFVAISAKASAGHRSPFSLCCFLHGLCSPPPLVVAAAEAFVELLPHLYLLLLISPPLSPSSCCYSCAALPQTPLLLFSLLLQLRRPSPGPSPLPSVLQPRPPLVPSPFSW